MRDSCTLLAILLLLFILVGCASATKKAAWTFDAGYQWAEAAVGDDGTVYCAGEDGFVYALNPEGRELWRCDTTARISSGPVLGPDGSLYVFNGESKLVSISSAGKLQWKKPIECGGRTGMVTTTDNAVYVSTLFKDFYAYSPKGERLWAKAWDAGISNKLLIHDSYIYIGAGGKNNPPHHHLYCLNLDGSIEWYYDAHCSVESSPVLIGGELIAVGTEDGLIAVDLQGNLRWSCLETIKVTGEIVNLPDGNIVCSTGTAVHAVNESGGVIWTIDLKDVEKNAHYSNMRPAVDSQGNIYLGVGLSPTPPGLISSLLGMRSRTSGSVQIPGCLFAISSEGEFLWCYKYKAALNCAPAVGNGMVYAVSWDGKLHAVPIE